MDEETVNPQDEIAEEIADPVVQEEAVETEPEKAQEQQKVPLSALHKERRKRQEIELENKWLKEQQARKPETVQEPDESRYESATKEDLSKQEREIIRKVEERSWIKQNPERYEKVSELLPEFLKRRPNLAAAIEGASNRYEEAWELMTALTPKEQQKMKTAAAPKKDAPGSPSSVPKGAAMNQAVDVMSMSDAEFSSWRQSQKRNR